MQLGTIEGKVDTSSFKFRATEEVKKFDFVSVKSNEKWILAQVEEVTKNPEGETMANASIIGYRDKGLTKAPRRVIESGSIVYQADQELISETLGLEEAGLRIGNLETNPEIDIFVDKDDFYKHFGVLAQTGAGKCVTPDTEVLMSDGRLRKIKNIFESSDNVLEQNDSEELRILNECSVKAVNDNYEEVDADALYAYRKRAEKIFKFKTSSGREVKVTAEHPLLVAEGGYSFKQAEKLEEGQHIGVPRRLSASTSGKNINISDELLRRSIEEKKDRMIAEKKHENFKRLNSLDKGLEVISEKLDLSKSTVENWKYQGLKPLRAEGYAFSQKSKGIDFPENFSEEVAEFLSLVIAEGTEQQGNSYRILFTNNNERLIQRFEELSEKLFNLQPAKARENVRYVDSTSLKVLLEEIGYETLEKSRGKNIPEVVLKSSKKSKKRFLKTFFDCEGCMEDHEISLSSASEEIVNRLSYMLLEFGIFTRLREKQKEATNSDHDGDLYYEIIISGENQMRRFAEKIGFGIGKKQQKLETYLEEKNGNTNTDVVPIEGEYLKRERKKLGMSQRELSEEIGTHSTLISLYERNERRPSREKFGKMAEELDSVLYKDLATSDVFWDKIESIEEVEHEGYAYDLTVRDHHNFIAGKGGIICHNSYTVGVLCEEMLEEDVPLMIVDPHGEYSSLSEPNPEAEKLEAKGYDVTEYSPNTDINQNALPLTFSAVNMEKKELLDLIPDSLTNSQMGVLYNALKRLKDKEEDYNLTDIMDAVSQEDSTAKWNLLNSMEQIDESGILSENPVDLEDILTPGEASVINLKAVEPEIAEMTMFLLAKRMFELRKKNMVPPFIMVIEEAHNFAPEKGFEQALSNKILRKIASEGRKFGLGLGVISQRPARIDKNVLSQCNTQFILRVTNPNDLKAISKSFEGITSEVETMIKSLPPGVAFVLGNEYPVMTDVRTRKSKHGGTTQTSENYEEKDKVKLFKPGRSLEDLETEKGVKYELAYYPVYLVDKDDVEVLIDAVSGEEKARTQKISGKSEKVFSRIKGGETKQEIVEDTDLSISKISSLINKLRKKGKIKEDSLEPKETLFDVETVDERVETDKLIEREIERSDLNSENSELVYYPYYSHGEDVYDPILQKDLD